MSHVHRPATGPGRARRGATLARVRALGNRVLTALAVLVLAAGCGGSANSTPAPTSTPSPTATPTATPGPTATPIATTAPGQMTGGRSTHTASMLADGWVLVAGGFFNAVPVVSADLYDPQTSTFTATGPMATARGFDTATLLTDGRVLFAGGSRSNWADTGPFFASAELYDPKTGTFSPTGSMATGRDFHTATRLADGRVLIAGGGSAGWTHGHFLASAEIYDPKTGMFTATGPMTTERALQTATPLADGRVLITGGVDSNGTTSLASAELYDPKTGKFSATGPMADGRTFHAATLLADGRVLVTGGLHTGWDYKAPFLASAEIFDPKTSRFTATGPMTDGRVSHTATLLSDGRVLIAGGFDGSADLASAELYDPTSGTFKSTGSGG